MKKFTLSAVILSVIGSSAIGSSAIGSSAIAQTVQLKGDAAVNFIHKYWPEAPIPGAFDGSFKCFVPAMGGIGNGEVPKCTLNGHG